MGQSTEELTENIEKSRRNLSRDIDELSDKVSPGKVVHRQKQAAVDRLSSIRESVMGSAADTGNAVSGKASDAVGSAQSAAQDVAQNAAHAAQGAVRTTKGNPLAAGLAAFGIGLVVSSMIPASKREAEVAKAAVDVAKEQAQPILEEPVQHLKEAATSAVTDLKDTAQEAVAHVQDETTSSVETVKNEAKSSAASVKDDALDATQSLKQTAGGDSGSAAPPATAF